MFYIEHNSDNLTIIDCCLNGDTHEEILDEIASLNSKKGVVRFISTHPDDDHLRGLELLDARIKIRNFYCVANDATKTHETDSFDRYCELRDSETAFHIHKGCTRKWMNQNDDQRSTSGVNILWPDPRNEFYQEALQVAADGGCPNNISAVIKYSVENSATVLWMGDLETRCLVPAFGGAYFSQGWKEALWDKFYTGAPQRRARPRCQPRSSRRRCPALTQIGMATVRMRRPLPSRSARTHRPSRCWMVATSS
jgi:hypothetical protein